MEKELGNGWADNVHPDDLDCCLQIYVTQFDARQPFSMEYRLRRHDGLWRWILDKGIPTYDAAREFTGYIGSCVDINNRREAEERVHESTKALGESESRFRQLTESLPQLVWTCRAEGTCDYLSPQWVAYTGIPEHPQLGFGWLGQLHPDDRQRTIEKWNEIAPIG